MLRRMVPLVLAIWVCAAGLAYVFAREEVDEAQVNLMLDLTRAAARLHEQQIEDGDLQLMRGPDAFEGRESLLMIIAPEGTVLYSSYPEFVRPAGLPDGTHRLGDWSILQSRTASGNTIVTGILAEESDEMLLQLVLSVALPLGLALTLSGMVMVVIVTTELAPLRMLAQTVRRRRPDSMSTIPGDDLPTELRPIVGALNGLFDRLRAFLDRERRFVDEAAHELRTPLTIIKAQAQAFDRDHLSPENGARLDGLLQGVDMAASVSDALLASARAQQAAAPAQPVAALALAQAVVDRLVSLSQAAPDLRLDGDGEVQVLVNPDDLRTMLVNVVQNALSHGGPDVQVRIEVGQAEGAGLIAVEDSGPGIPEAHRDAVFDRFFRLGRRDAAGAGLGLSIVRTLAQRNGGTARAEAATSLGGARIVLSLPLA